MGYKHSKLTKKSRELLALAAPILHSYGVSLPKELRDKLAPARVRLPFAVRKRLETILAVEGRAVVSSRGIRPRVYSWEGYSKAQEVMKKHRVNGATFKKHTEKAAV